MKKLISILLVIMLVIGMFPATTLTAFAADTTIEFALGANGNATHADGSSKTSYSETVDGYTLNITGGTNMYTGARDAKGNSCIKLGSSKNTGGFKFTVPADVTKVVIAIGKYKTNTTKVTVNGTAYTISGASNNGEYDAIEVDTSSTKTVSLTTVSGGVRAMVNTITYVIPAEEGACEHPEEKLTLKTEQQDATCTAVGYKAIYTCECGEEVGGEEIPAINHANKVSNNDAIEADCETEGFTDSYYCPDCETTIPAVSTGYGDHNYVDGTCSVCGAAQPSEVTATISFANTTQRTSYSTSAQVWQSDDGIVTFTNNKGSSTSNVGDYSNPARLYKSSEIVVSCAEDYLIKSITFVAGGADSYKTPWKATLEGANVTPVIDGDNYTVTFATGVESFTCVASAQIRIASLSVTCEAVGGSSEPDCEHTNTIAIGEAKAATCTEEGITAGKKCADCEYVLEEQETIPAINHANKVSNNDAIEADCETEGFTDSYYCPDCETTIPAVSTGYGDHNYVDGECSVCGEAEPSEQTIDFATADQRVSLDNDSQVWKSGNVTFTNNKAESTNNVADYTDPARFYKSSALVIEAPSNITTIVFNCDSADYATALQSSIGDEATVEGKVVTLTPAEAATSYTIAVLTGQVRMNSVTVSYKADGAEPECTHENKVSNNDAQAPTCVAPGQTNSYTCPDCGETIDAEPIPATGEHNYVDGTCTTCGATEPARYYIAAYRDSEDKYYYMTSDLGTNSTKRYQAVATDILPSSIDPDEADSNYVFILTDNGDGTCYLQAESIDGDNYLYHSGTANSGNYTSQENALKLSMTVTEDGKYNFHYAGSDEERYLSLNSSKDQNYFAWYKNTQKYNLTLIPIEEAENLTATLYADVDGLTVAGELKLDLNGHNATNVTATKIYAIDSSATATTEGDGSLTTTSEVVMDNTVDGVRYIALENEGAYTFHVLEMKLSAVSLRTSAAGIYYKAIVNCDETLAGAVSQYGIALSTRNMPGANFATEFELNGDVNGWTVVQGNITSGQAFTSGSVFGIFKEGLTNNAARGEVKIYANAYIIVDGTTIMADTTTGDKTTDTGFNGIAWSLKDVMVKLNETFTTLSEKNQEAVAEFYSNWSSAMGSWNLTAIADAAANLPA